MLIGTTLDLDNRYRFDINKDIGFFDFNKNDDTYLSSLNFNFNFYEYMKSNIDSFRLNYHERDNLLDFIEGDKELNKLLVSLRKDIQKDHTDIVCETVTGRKYPLYNDAREIKRNIVEKIADTILENIKKDLTEDFDSLKLSNFETKINIGKIPLYSGNAKYTTSKDIEICPEFDYPDDKVKTIIKDKFADLQRVFEDTIKERDLDNEEEEEIER